MSVISATTSSTQGGFVTEVRLEYKKIKAEGISHMIPTLEGLRIPGQDLDNPSVQRVVDNMKAAGTSVKTFPVQWKGKSADEMRRQLAPMVSHYKKEALLLLERTKRRGIENSEFTERCNRSVAFHYSAPLTEKMMHHYTANVLSRLQQQEQDDGGSYVSGQQSNRGRGEHLYSNSPSIVSQSPSVKPPWYPLDESARDPHHGSDIGDHDTSFDYEAPAATMGIGALHPALAEDAALELLENEL